MSENRFLSLLNTRKILVSDGATGTNLIQRGLPRGMSAEAWLLEKPDAILQLHKDFISAGADIILAGIAVPPRWETTDGSFPIPAMPAATSFW